MKHVIRTVLVTIVALFGLSVASTAPASAAPASAAPASAAPASAAPGPPVDTRVVFVDRHAAVGAAHASRAVTLRVMVHGTW